MKKTANELIHIGCPIQFDEDAFLKQLEALMIAAYSNKSNIRSLVERMVPTYHPQLNRPAEKKDEKKSSPAGQKGRKAGAR